MTKENRKKLYDHYKDLAANYVAPPRLNSGPTSTARVRKNAEEHVKEMLLRHPELEVKKEEPKEKVEVKKKKVSKKKKVV